MNASERERLWIEGRYYESEGDLDRPRQIYEELVRLYPNYLLGFNSIGNVLRQSGDYEKALPMYYEVIRLLPEASLGYTQVLNTLIRLDRFKEAHAVAELPAVKRLNPPDVRLMLLRLSYLEGDLVATQAAIQDLEGTRSAVESPRLSRPRIRQGSSGTRRALQARGERPPGVRISAGAALDISCSAQPTRRMPASARRGHDLDPGAYETQHHLGTRRSRRARHLR